MRIKAAVQTDWKFEQGVTTSTSSPGDELDRLVELCCREEASDLHLTPNLPPYLRINGRLEAMDNCGKLSAAMIETFIHRLTDKDGLERLEASGSQDGAFTSLSGVRFRFNIMRHQGELSLILRRLEERFRTLAELGIPEQLYKLCDLNSGLVLVAGPTGAGKSTTLASLLDRINQTRACHLVTIEDPIEYVHRPKLALIRQRQIGTDASNFNDALQSSLRQDPDVILVGEIRDQATIQTAITAAEAGHLVFSTVHASDTVGAVDRLVSMFSTHEQVGMRCELSRVLRAVIAQHLLPVEQSEPPGQTPAIKPTDRRKTAGESSKPKRAQRVAICEIMIGNTAVSNLIATGKTTQLYSLLEAGEADGMQSFDRDLARLWIGQLISEQTATRMSRNPKVMKEQADMQRRRQAGPTAMRRNMR